MGRNTLEMLKIFQELKDLQVEVYFEVENLYLSNSDAMLMLTIFAALAQTESENKSYNICWGIHRRFQTGISKFLNKPCYGYSIDDSGKLSIDEDTAKVVRRIFQWREKGYSLRVIAGKLKNLEIPAPRSGHTWGTETLSKILANEKYTGDVLLQKTFVEEYFIGKQAKNKGKLTRYLAEKSSSCYYFKGTVYCSGQPSVLMINEIAGV